MGQRSPLGSVRPTKLATYLRECIRRATKHVGGIAAGSNAGGGFANGLDVNGAVGTVRPFRWLTAGIERWRLAVDTTAEAGASAGTGRALTSSDDTGTLLNTFLTATRLGAMGIGVPGKELAMKAHLVSASAAVTVAGGAQSSSAAASGNGANDQAGTLNVTAVVSPAAGALATVTFATPYTTVPHVVLTPQTSGAASCQPYVGSRSATGFTVFAASAPGSGAAVQFDYHVVA